MDARLNSVSDVVGSVRAEGLEPGADVVALLEAHATGALSDSQLDEAEKALLSGGSVKRFLPVTAR